MRRCNTVLLVLWMLLALPVAAASAGPATPEAAGLVDIAKAAPDVRLDIRYATPNNFTKVAVYPAAKCYLRADVAARLARVQADLEKQGLGLKVYDCYRPFSIQKKFWALVPNEDWVAKPVEKDGKPVSGSKHNRGAAVDLTLVDAAGNELPMPSGFDDFTEKARRDYTGGDKAALTNSRRLEAAMRKEGFEPLPSEWWHFDGPGWQGYELLDAPIN
ncbi:M15 family metallopeptidase [Solidesulfovibrio sp.]|uniref:M15 family metallopeptidase n=1 Tax=Solidesulfovibrio sp. TaxID=2910990 RepID=UPI000EE1A074|nr:M15 family metallopeptidase [Solidesulfovibrio sp.]MEA5087639.1 M15 family metallopeptidase [Solidesulfovibrio sp.]HCR13189.1 peptidase M15 [Desulfovibrio sp.]HML61228.1 M15 family metallopeptidase [Solidesulfovibrio sp.]